MLLVHHFHAALQDGYLMLQGNDLVFDGIGQAVVIEVDVAFAVAGFDAFALLDDDAARDADDCRVRRYFFEDDGTGADFCAFADGKGTEDFGTAGDDDVVADGRMAFAFFLTRPAEGHALIEGNVVADDRRFSDDNAHAMVNEQAFANLGAGMDLDAREEAGNGGNDAGRDKPLMLVEEVGQAMGPDGMKAGIAKQDFQRILSSWIAVLDDANVVAK